MTAPVFASAAVLYHQAGWPAVLPVPPETKSPPPTGFTGAEGHDTSPEQLAAWVNNGYAGHSIALRMPDGIIGIDVDHYMKGEVQKRGGDTLETVLARWGPLPPTWTSTARGTGPSRIAFYRVPPGRYATVIQPDIEIIQRHHRYAVVWPSPHSEVGSPYRWYDPDGAPTEKIPGPGELPELPQTWVDRLREGASQISPASADRASGDALLTELIADTRPHCTVTYDALVKAAHVLLSPDTGGRHDAMTGRVYVLVMEAAMGHTGFGVALPALREQWVRLTPSEDREGEFDRMLLTAARKAVTALAGARQLADPCESPGGPQWAGITPSMLANARPRPGDDRQVPEEGSDPLEPLNFELPPKLVDPSWGQVIGTTPFEPEVDVDQKLAQAMLMRTYPMVRRISDTKTSAWLLRGVEQWTLEGDLSGRIVAECAELMPKGDPTAVVPGGSPTPEQRAYKRRMRMMTNGPASAVASTIRRLTDGGRHPATTPLAELDNDPEILWAGGWPWDLRACTEHPTVAGHVDPNTPHLVAAGVSPADVPTPRWDAFTTAVWPDPEVRGWALRVLSIAFTGYADAALPVLFGEGGTGKTSVITLLMEVLGSYAHAADHRLLGGDENHASIVFALKGRRLSFIDEAMREGTRNTERLKQLTGGGQLTGNAMRLDPVTFNPTHTLVLTSNPPPTVSDPALRRRVRLLPCDGDPDAVRTARQALRGRWWAAEAPGVLARMMREAAAWLADPNSALTPAAPLAVQYLMSDLAQSQDPIAQWLTEAVVPHEVGTRGRELYVGFRSWCRDGGVRESAIPTETAWALALDKHGFPKIRRADANYRPLMFRPDDRYVVRPLPPSSGVAHVPPNPPSSPPSAQPPSMTAQVELPGFAEGSFGYGVSPPETASGVEGSWTVSGGLAAEPPMPQNPSSPYLSSSSMEGLEGYFRPIKKEEEVKEREGGVELGAQLAGSTGEPTLPSIPSCSTSDSMIDSPPCQESPSVTDPAAPAKRTRLTPEEKAAQRKAATVAAKQVELQARIAEAAGELHPLPVVVDRAGHVLPCTPDQAAAVVRAALVRSGALTVDVETSGYPVGHQHHELRTVQLGDATAAVVLDPQLHGELITTLLGEAPRLHAHSASADLVPLAHAGLVDIESCWERMFDTVIPAKLADPQSTGSDPGLKQLAGTVLGDTATAPAADQARAALWKAGKWLTDTKPDTPPERSGWAQVDPGCETMARYAASDVLDTAALAQALPWPAGDVLDRERTAQRMTARVADRGFRLDGEHIAAMTEHHRGEQARLGAIIRAAGIENPGSPQQVGRALASLGAELPRTPAGSPSVAADVLGALRAAEGSIGELAQTLIDYRHFSTALGLFLEPFGELVRTGDGRVRSTVYTLGPDTGRFSCVRPNLQQLSREGGIRACITADPGQLLISADFTGVEIRVAAALSGDPTLAQLLADGRDLHDEVAAMVYGPEWTKADRYNVKRAVFGRLYGGGVPTIAKQCGISESMAGAVVDSLDALTPVLSGWSNQMREAVKRGHTEFVTYSGRVIHLPRQWPHKAPNYGIQGSARELLVDALVRWSRTRWGQCVLVPVHDELVVAVPEDEAEEATHELVTCMESQLNGIRISVDPDPPSFAWQDSV